MQLCKRLTFLLGIMLWSAPGFAAFHLWDIAEIYSNADGSIQFVELHTTSGGQGVLSNHTLSATSDGNMVIYNIPTDVDSNTANRRLLFATPMFSGAPGAVTPDFVLPENFLDISASSFNVNFADFDDVNFTSADLPTDGLLSLNDDLTTDTNSPTNFAGETGQLGEEFFFADGFEDTIE